MINFKLPERRQGPRIKFKEKVQVINAVLEDGSTYSKLTKAVNLSERGMMVLLPKRLQMSSQAIVVFNLPDSSKSRITAKVLVIWVVPGEEEGFFNTGVQFIDLQPLKQTTIRAFLYDQRHINDDKNSPNLNPSAQ